jgi:hypothetical protein
VYGLEAKKRFAVYLRSLGFSGIIASVIGRGTAMNVFWVVLGIALMAIGLIVMFGSIATHSESGPIWGVLVGILGVALGFGGWLNQIGKVADKSLEERNRWLAQWRLLRAGMTESDVHSLIGSPDEVEALVAMTGDMACRRRYGSFFSKGTIVFHQGKVVSFTVPSR